MMRHITMLIMIAGLSSGMLLSTCLAGLSGNDSNQVGSQATQVENASGDANQVSVLHSDADPVEAVNEALTPAASRVNRVLSLDGQDDCMRVADSQSLQSFTDAITIEVSLMASSLYMEDGKINSVVRKNVASRAENFLLRFRTVGGSPRAQMGLGELGTLQAPSEFAANNWYHLAGTYDGRVITVFVNGLAVASQNASGRLHIDQSDLYVGMGDPASFSSGEYFHGALDEIRIWNVARSQEQIQAAMNASLTGKEEGLVACWNFDDGTAKDLSGHGNDGILDGDARIVESFRPTLAASEQNQKPGKLLGWWKFDETDGNSVADASGNGRVGTRVGNPQWRPDAGKIGGALEFDGDGDQVDIAEEPPFDVTDTITVAAWIKVKAFDKRWQSIVTKGDSAWRLQRTAERDTLAFHCTGIQSEDPEWPQGVQGRKNVNDGQWHHVVGVYDGATASLYIDGVLDSSSAASGQVRTNDASVVIGGNSEVSSREWNGLIDEVGVLGCAMNAEEVAALYAGQDLMALAAQIGGRPPVATGAARIEPSSRPTATTDVAMPVPEHTKNKSGSWLKLLVALAGAGLIVWVYGSRFRSPAHRGVSERRDIGGSLRHLAHGVAGMTWKIARKEFLLNLMTFKFAVGTAVCVVLMAVFMPGLVKDYEERLANYNGSVAANEAEFQKVKVYNNLTPTVYRAPAVLSVFSKGIADRLENSERIDLDEVSGAETGVGEANTLLSVFPSMDVTLILKIVISVLALLMAYDVVSGEREQGTLRLILSNTAPRHQLLLGKLIAGWMTLAVPVTAAFIVGLLILLMSKAVSLTAADWLRIGLMYLVSLIFVASMFNLGLLLSSVSRSSAVSLVFALFLWLIFAAILPNASAHLAAQLRPIESPEQFAAKLKAITNRRDQEIADLTKDIQEGEGSSRSDGEGAFGNGLLVFANKPFMDYLKQMYPITEPHKIQCIDRLLDVKAEYLGSLVRQKQLADTLAGVTPIILCERLMSALAGTDFDNFGSFKNRVRTYRHEVADYIRDKTDSFTATIYFTPSKEGDQERFFETFFKPYDEAQDKALKAKLYETAMQKYQQAAKDAPTLALADFPQFRHQSQPLAITVQQVIPTMGLLILQGALFFALSFVAFLRYDVR